MATFDPSTASNPANERKSYPTGIVGHSWERRSKAAAFKQGETALGNDNTVWRYVKATAALTEGGTCAVNAAGEASAGAGYDVLAADFASGDFGWVRKTAPAF